MQRHIGTKQKNPSALCIALVSLATALAAFLWDSRSCPLRLPRALGWPLLGLWALAVPQLVPLPQALHHWIAPGSAAVWHPDVPAAAAVLGPGPHPVSLYPEATRRWMAFATGGLALALAAAPALRNRHLLLRASIAVVARSNYRDSDLVAFGERFTSLLPRPPVRVLATPGMDPGIGVEEVELEVLLDLQWAGAVAPEATVRAVIATPEADVVEALEADVGPVVDAVELDPGPGKPGTHRHGELLAVPPGDLEKLDGDGLEVVSEEDVGVDVVLDERPEDGRRDDRRVPRLYPVTGAGDLFARRLGFRGGLDVPGR